MVENLHSNYLPYQFLHSLLSLTRINIFVHIKMFLRQIMLNVCDFFFCVKCKAKDFPKDVKRRVGGSAGSMRWFLCEILDLN